MLFIVNNALRSRKSSYILSQTELWIVLIILVSIKKLYDYIDETI